MTTKKFFKINLGDKKESFRIFIQAIVEYGQKDQLSDITGFLNAIGQLSEYAVDLFINFYAKVMAMPEQSLPEDIDRALKKWVKTRINMLEKLKKDSDKKFYSNFSFY